MKLQDQVIPLDAAKRLKELGVRQHSAFQWALGAEFNEQGDICAWHPELVFCDKEDNDICFGEPMATTVDNGSVIVETKEDEYYAAFTVAELGEMIPEGYDTMKTTPIDDTGNRWRGYDLDGNDYPLETLYPTEAQARAEMLLHLLQHNLISVEQVNRRLG